MNEDGNGDGVGLSSPLYITRAECKLMGEKIDMKVETINDHITSNTESIDKLNKTLMGNGDDGLVLMMNRLMWKNQIVEKGTSILIAIISSAITAYILRVLT